MEKRIRQPGQRWQTDRARVKETYTQKKQKEMRKMDRDKKDNIFPQILFFSEKKKLILTAKIGLFMIIISTYICQLSLLQKQSHT